MRSSPIPLLGLAGALAAGAFAGGAGGPAAAAALLGAAALLLGCALAAGRLNRYALAAAALAIGAAGADVERLAYERASLWRWLQEEPSERPVLVEGVLLRDAWREGDRGTLLVEVEALAVAGSRTPVAGRARVSLGGSAGRLELSEGERVRVWAQLRPPRGFATPGAFDALARAFAEGVHALGHCKSALLIERAAGRAPAPLAGFRMRARRLIADALPAGAEQGVVRAMVLGDRAAVDPDTAEALRVAGTYHVLAISGAQVALVAGLVVFVLRRVRVAPVPSAVLLCAAVWAYASFVGGDTPVLRAALTATILFVGRALELDAEPLNLLGLAAGLLLVQRPSAISDISFQLSFGATLGILWLGARLVDGMRIGPLWLRWAVAASLAAQAALLPLLAAHFHRLAPAALALNLLAVPLASLVLVCGFGFLGVALLLPGAGQWLADASWFAAHLLLRSGEAVREWPALDLRVPTPAAWAVAAYGVGLALLAARRGVGRAALAIGIGLAGTLVGPGAPADGRLHLTVLDVGQGDSLVLTSPSGRTLLVDAGASGERFDAGEAVVGPYLWHTGVTALDGLVLSHPHPDHVGGAGFVARAFPGGEVLEGVAPRDDASYRSLEAALRRAGVARRSISGGVSWSWDGVRITVLGPRPAGSPPRRTRNDDSLVLLVRFGATSFLLAGDVEAGGERRLEFPRIDVLKVAHHGSRTSTHHEFLRRASPRAAVVSVGYKSPFGHPHEEVVERLRAVGAHVFRTDLDGAVRFSSDGERIWAASERSGVAVRVR